MMKRVHVFTPARYNSLYYFLSLFINVLPLICSSLARTYRFVVTKESKVEISSFSFSQAQQYGSFCLRFGAVGFGAGSLVFTGLQIGAEIASGPFRAITPAARLLLITAQMHFIFLNSKNLEFARLGALAKLGLMHMIATNLCEWLQVSEKRPSTISLFSIFF